MQVGKVGGVLVLAAEEVGSLGVMVEGIEGAKVFRGVAVKEAVVAGDVDGRIGQVTAQGVVAVEDESIEDVSVREC